MVEPGEDLRANRLRWREERMRYEVLAAIYHACGAQTGCELRVADFTEQLGIWREELFRVLDFLDRRRYIEYHGAGPLVSVTQQGIDYVEHLAQRRRSLRDEVQ
jgi:CTP-dependent riboflavin kinase